MYMVRKMSFDTEIIVAFESKKLGIGRQGSLPWRIKEDLQRFKSLTKDSIVVMGRKTYLSIPECNRPLKHRVNIVMTSNPSELAGVHVATDMTSLKDTIDRLRTTQKVFIIGGSSLYAHFMGTATKIHATVVTGNFDECDTVFPSEAFHRYEIEDYSPMYRSQNEGCDYRFITYTLRSGLKLHDEFVYLDNLENILKDGNMREDRTGTGTLSLFGPQLRFDLTKSFPLLTTKFVGYKSVLKELLFFLRGDTDSKILESQGVNIWKANTSREFLDKRGLSQYREGDMGPMYFFVVRHIGADYQGCDANYSGKGIDQLEQVIQGLKDDPFSRRHLMTTYCPLYNDQGCLLPCHGIVIQFYVEQRDGLKLLSCHVYIRSNDTFLGQAWNIASYAALTQIVAIKCDMKPKELIISIGDCHLYKNHIEQATIQLSRSPRPFPVLHVNPVVKNKKWEDIMIDDFELVGYLHHPMIKAPLAI
jgi:dihydrofolate reductase / thymidylate synthase